MTKLQIFLDVTMCVCWMITYILVLISTKIYRYPAISPYTQVFALSVEIGGFIARIIWKFFDFFHFCYLFWSLIEIVIIVEIIRLKFLKNLKLYFASIGVLSAAFAYLVVVYNIRLFLTYFISFCGDLIWLAFILKNKDYPFKPLNLAAFLIKFIADVVCVPVYLGRSYIFVDIICIALPSLDFLFIIVYFLKEIGNRNQQFN